MKIWNEALGYYKSVALYYDVPDCPLGKTFSQMPHVDPVTISVDPDTREAWSSLGHPKDSAIMMNLPPKDIFPSASGYTYRDLLVHELGERAEEKGNSTGLI